eukprot:5390187-Prymnesium_polylepis.2
MMRAPSPSGSTMAIVAVVPPSAMSQRWAPVGSSSSRGSHSSRYAGAPSGGLYTRNDSPPVRGSSAVWQRGGDQ